MGFNLSLFVCISLLNCFCNMQPGETAANVTHPQEVAALKIIDSKMRYEKWNFSTDPCSGKGSWNVSQSHGSENWVACNCNVDGDFFCHITNIFLKRQDLSGVVPPEITNLTYLIELDLTRNYLSGSIPPELGSMIHLKNLSLGINRLSGNIPKELGNISSLRSLVVLSNNLSGQLVEELGNLSKLERFHIGMNQFTGKIPETFSNLKGLYDFRASSNNFVGRIPDFIGNWKNISILRFQATSLEGPIPSVISGLTNLSDLRISYLTTGGSNLSFINSQKDLKNLVLSNALIYGEIPSCIGDFKKLNILDLRFNNLTGAIPDTFQNFKNNDIEGSQYLYLGNNSLSGELQPWLSQNIHLDLSYNNFSGDFPRWLENSYETKLNLVGNSFKTNLPITRDLAYLQKKFICYTGYQHDTLAINCGGGSWFDANTSIKYEADRSAIGPSSYFLSKDKKWAISNTGVTMDNKSETTSIKQLSHTSTHIELYRTARSSLYSLRYYALCLYNGKYKVQLQFAEIEFSNNRSYTSLGRRIFDVYIQGTKVLQNFNIKEAAGGADKVVIKTFTATVTQNYLEIHFLWAGKGTYNVPEEGTYGPLISAIVVTPDFKINKSSTLMIVGIVFGVLFSLGLAAYFSFIFIKKRNNRFQDNHLDRELMDMKGIYNSFSLEEIRSATRDFHSENKIGEGGFGAVFKGILADGNVVAVKKTFSKRRQRNREFLNEIATISAVQHPNLVKLYGSCIEEKQLLLVYEYLENNSLARALFGAEEFKLNLNWPARYNICLGVARGLAYLHEESRLRIVHRDIKSTNILLDKDLNPKISDFGLAKLFDREKTHVSTRVAGTIGYMAPEYALKGHLTEKADVYSFGVVVLEIVSGRPNTEKKLQGGAVYLTEMTWNLYGEKRQLDLVDVSLKSSSYSDDEVLRTINVGLLCIQANPMLRPSMSTVVNMLEGKTEVPISRCQPPYLSYRQYQLITQEEPLSLKRSLTLEESWKGSSTSQAASSVKQEKAADYDNDENTLISHQVSADLYRFSISDNSSSQSYT